MTLDEYTDQRVLTLGSDLVQQIIRIQDEFGTEFEVSPTAYATDIVGLVRAAQVDIAEFDG